MILYLKTYIICSLHTSLPSDVIHDFVLPFTWHVTIRQNNLDVLPSNVVVHAVRDIEAKALYQVVHELCPRGDALTFSGGLIDMPIATVLKQAAASQM